MPPLITTETQDDVAIVRIDHPPANALNPELLDAGRAAAAELRGGSGRGGDQRRHEAAGYGALTDGVVLPFICRQVAAPATAGLVSSGALNEYTPCFTSDLGDAPGSATNGCDATPDPSALNWPWVGDAAKRSSSGRLVAA